MVFPRFYNKKPFKKSEKNPSKKSTNLDFENAPKIHGLIIKLCAMYAR